MDAAGRRAAALQRGAPGAQGSRRARAGARVSSAAASGRASSPSIPRPTTCTRRWCWVSDKLARAEEKLGARRRAGTRSITRGASSIARSATAATGTASSAGSISTTCATRSIAICIEAEAHAERVLGTGDKPLVVEARPRRRSAARGDPAERRGGGVREARPRRRRVRARLSARSASTCSTCSGGAPRAITGACSRRRSKSAAGGGGGPVSIHDLERGQVGGARGAARATIAIRGSAFVDHFLRGGHDARRRWRGGSYDERRRLRRRAVRGRRPERERRGGARAPAPARARGRARGHRRQDAHARGRAARRAAYRISAEGAPGAADLRLGVVADAARRRRARSLLPRRRPRARQGRAQAGVDAASCPRARRSSWSTSGTSSSCASRPRRGAIMWRHPARDRVAVRGRLRAHLPGVGDGAGLARVAVGDGQPFECKVTIEMVVDLAIA